MQWWQWRKGLKEVDLFYRSNRVLLFPKRNRDNMQKKGVI